MIKANKKNWFFSLFQTYTKYWLFKRSFSSIHIRIDQEYDLAKPLLLMANHSSWWDGMVAVLLSKHQIKHQDYIMMSEDGLTKYPFFKYLGAFSVNTANPKSVLQSLAYTAELLEKKQAVWIFPQGEETPLEKRPLDFNSGVGWISKHSSSELQLAPVTFSYSFMAEQRPRLYIHLGKTMKNTFFEEDKRNITALIETTLTQQLDQQRQQLIEQNFSSYQPLLEGKKSVSDWFQFLSKSKEEKSE